MVGALRFVLACLLGAGAGLASPSPGHAAGCEAIVGTWTWFTGGVVSINADGTMVHDPGNDGTWECTDRARGRVTLRWRVGGYVNRLALSADGAGLSSTDPSQSFVTAKRADAPSRPAPSRPAPRTTDAPRPAQPAPRTPDAPPPAPSKPAPRTADAPRPPSEPPSTPPAGPAPPRGAPAREGAGPCSGNACASAKVFTEGGCVWLRNSVPAVLNVEVRLEKETLKMTLEAGDKAKAGPSGDARSSKPRRSGTPARADLARTRHTTTYDVLSGSDRAVFEARVGTPAGCVTKPEAIVGYAASFASAADAKTFAIGAPEPESISCSGDACRDLDHRVEEIKACRLTNTGRREIKVGIFMNGNRQPSMSASVAPTKAMPLTYFTGCLRAQDIDRIEASYQ